MNKRVKRAANQDSGIAARVVIVIVLTLTLVGVLRWSMNVTKANARQISHNLTQIQQQMAAEAARRQGREETGESVQIGPSIDPVGRGTR